MSLFIVGVITGIATMSLLVWKMIVRPLRQLSENIEKHESTGDFPFSAKRKHPEIQRLQGNIVKVLLDLERHRKSTEKLEGAKQEFLSLVSHELRTPLTSIKGSLSLIIDGVLGPVGNRSLSFLKIAQSEVDRLISLVNDILDIAKLETGQLKQEKIWFNPHEVLDAVQSGLMGLQQKTGIAIVIEPKMRPCEIYGDPKRIQQLLTNFVSNAISHSPKRGMVIIGIDIRENGLLRFYVIDQGPGISADNQKKIFKKFVQANSPSSNQNGGTGLGLAICKSIAKRHNGKVGVQSDIGNGSLFFFEIPNFRYTSKNRIAAAIKENQNEAA